MFPVIMSGGSGSRLWPLSRQQTPKQFLKWDRKNSMFQDALVRLQGLSVEQTIVVCNKDHRFVAAEHLREISITDASILLEPCGRNTAPAITVAALHAMNIDPDAILLVLPADHIIADTHQFQEAILSAEKAAKEGKLVTFGIVPDAPHTGYGYIKSGKKDTFGLYQVNEFVEKPNKALAETFLQEGNYSWNSGMFIFQAKTFISELNKYEPEIIHNIKKALINAEQNFDFIWLEKESFSNCKNISIDYAVMEHTDRASVLPIDVGWNDIGSWSSYWDVNEKDRDGNILKGDTITVNTSDCLIQSEYKLVATVGVNDLIIVDTKDAVMVASKNNSQSIKDVVEILKSQNRTETIHHRTVYRPWGHYDSLDVGDCDQVKRINVKPGAKLSIQKHMKRAEHWVVVKGAATVTKGDETFLLNENESTYIPIGVIHSLENATDEILEIIEVQCGDYVGEDDIIRFSDIYGRS